MIKRLLLPTAFLAIIVIASCEKKECKNSPLCDLEPKEGPCSQSIKKYYYDSETRKCKEFIWRGCGGVIPYHTLDSCKLECECK